MSTGRFFVLFKFSFKGGRGGPQGSRVQIMENELECVGDRKGHDADGHLA